MTINSCSTCKFNRIDGDCAIITDDVKDQYSVCHWCDYQIFDDESPYLPLNPKTSCPGWQSIEPDLTKSCRERGDHYQNCGTCPDLTCGDNTNESFKQAEYNKNLITKVIDFKVGDKVEVLPYEESKIPLPYFWKSGRQLTIRKISKNFLCFEGDNAEYGGGWFPERFKLVESTKQEKPISYCVVLATEHNLTLEAAIQAAKENVSNYGKDVFYVIDSNGKIVGSVSEVTRIEYTSHKE